MRAFKLLRIRSDGTLGPLFVDRQLVIEPGREFYAARDDLPHPGLAHRPGFHCCRSMNAPHIKLRLGNGERRVWCEVDIQDWTRHLRPESQGGMWYTAGKMRVRKVCVGNASGKYGTLFSSNGELVFRASDGAVVKSRSRWDRTVPIPERVDVIEWALRYPDEDVCAGHDILDFGMWVGGHYFGPEKRWREQFEKSRTERSPRA